MKKIVIIGSDEIAKGIHNTIAKYNEITFVNFNDYKQADKYLARHQPEFIIADVCIDEYCVTDLFVKHQTQCPIILMAECDNKEDFLKAQSVRPYIYLIKPFHMITLASACISLIGKFYQKKKSKDQFMIKTKGKFITINLNDVHYIASEGNNCVIHFKTTSHVIRYPLSKLLEDIKAPYMVRSHRKYIINLLKVDKFDVMKSLININDTELAVGRLFKKSLKSKLKARHL